MRPQAQISLLGGNFLQRYVYFLSWSTRPIWPLSYSSRFGLLAASATRFLGVVWSTGYIPTCLFPSAPTTAPSAGPPPSLHHFTACVNTYNSVLCTSIVPSHKPPAQRLVSVQELQKRTCAPVAGRPFASSTFSSLVLSGRVARLRRLDECLTSRFSVHS